MQTAVRLPKSIIPVLWDVLEPAKIDIKKYQSFIIGRVAERGGWADIQWLKKTYGVAAIRREVARSKNVGKKTKNFWKIV